MRECCQKHRTLTKREQPRNIRKLQFPLSESAFNLFELRQAIDNDSCKGCLGFRIKCQISPCHGMNLLKSSFSTTCARNSSCRRIASRGVRFHRVRILAFMASDFNANLALSARQPSIMDPALLCPTSSPLVLTLTATRAPCAVNPTDS